MVLGLCAAVVVGASTVLGGPAPDAQPLSESGPLVLELPVVDAPFNARNDVPFPSMAQAVAISRDVHLGLAWAIDLGFRHVPGPRWLWSLVGELAQVAAAVAFEWMPLGTAWNHEEFHRAVMSRYGVASFDDVWTLPFLSQTISVSHVTDEGLARLKAEHPADFTRLHAAGMEGDLELARAIDAQTFFDGLDARPSLPVTLLNRLNVIGYLWTCNSAGGDAMTDELAAAEGTDLAKRDFTGLDCTAWAYDATRPDEAYAARGVHPSGVGIDRYRKTTQLSPAGQALLRQGAWWSLANVVDLAGWGLTFPSPSTGSWRWTGDLAWQMSPFGWGLTVDVLAKRPGLGVRLTGRAFTSLRLVLPGLEAEWVRGRVQLAGVALEVSPAVGLWLQPEQLRWDAAAVRPGGFVRLRAEWRPLPRFGLFGEVQAKTAGWQPGTVALDPAIDTRLGVSVVL